MHLIFINKRIPINIYYLLSGRNLNIRNETKVHSGDPFLKISPIEYYNITYKTYNPNYL